MSDHNVYHPEAGEEVLVDRRHRGKAWVTVIAVSGAPGSADAEIQYQSVDGGIPDDTCFIHHILRTKNVAKQKALSRMRADDDYGSGFI